MASKDPLPADTPGHAWGLARCASTVGSSTWFSDSADRRTPAELQRETYIFYHPSTGVFNRWMVILPVLLVQICIGSLYSWSR